MKKNTTKVNSDAILSPKKYQDNYLIGLINYLIEHQKDENWLIDLLTNTHDTNYGGNRMFLVLKGPIAILYDYYLDQYPENGIKMNRLCLKGIFQVIQKANVLDKTYDISLQRDKKHITLIVKFDDKSELRKTFNYRWQDEPYSTTGDHYIDTLREFLYEHRWRAGGMISTLQDETRADFGINKMYMHIDGPEVTIYNYFDEDPSKNAIKISKDLLIKLLETIAEDEHADLGDIDITQSEKQITITVHYEDNTPTLSKTFTTK